VLAEAGAARASEQGAPMEVGKSIYGGMALVDDGGGGGSAHVPQMKQNEWEELTLDLFEELFKGSAVKRTKSEGLKRNIKFLSKSSHSKV